MTKRNRVRLAPAVDSAVWRGNEAGGELLWRSSQVSTWPELVCGQAIAKRVRTADGVPSSLSEALDISTVEKGLLTINNKLRDPFVKD